jgi:hypothetical protein
METKDVQNFLVQLEAIINDFDYLAQHAQYDDLSDCRTDEIQTLLTRSLAAILRVAGKSSLYFTQANTIVSDKIHDCHKLLSIIGVTKALRDDLKAGYMKSAEELIHGALFFDFIEMATFLVEEGYKDPAAVIAGASLESHLRLLCKKFSIEIMNPNDKPKKADSLNAEITKASGYSILDQKNITAWLDLRNKAAHGHFTIYTDNQVVLMISGIRDFITRNPA